MHRGTQRAERRRWRLFAFLCENAPTDIKNATLAELFNVSEVCISRDIKKLAEEGLIEPAYHWYRGLPVVRKHRTIKLAPQGIVEKIRGVQSSGISLVEENRSESEVTVEVPEDLPDDLRTLFGKAKH